jgi:LysR family transcriptional regulator, hydrogen peroxide-inducible genes activator
MTLQQLHYALSLAKNRSFKEAAQKLSITQPALSIQIQRLEEELGLIIFDRSHSPIQSTMDGQQFLLRAEEIVIGATNLKSFMMDLKKDVSGPFKLGIIPTLAPFLVPLFAEHLQTQHPNLILDFQEMLTNQVITAVRNGEIDAGLIATPVAVYGIQHTPIFYEKFYFYASEEVNTKKISLSTIDYTNLWLLNEGNCFRDQINDFCDLKEIQKGKSFIYRSNSIDALIRIVDTKGGVTILPELTTLSLSTEQENNISPISNKAREISLITRKLNIKERITDELILSIQTNIPAPMLHPEGLDVVDPGIEMS